MSAAEYIRFDALGIAPGRKTKRWHVFATRNGTLLGEVKWFGRWRQYAFFPRPDTVFNPDCLDYIASFLRSASREQRMATRKEHTTA